MLKLKLNPPNCGTVDNCDVVIAGGGGGGGTYVGILIGGMVTVPNPGIVIGPPTFIGTPSPSITAGNVGVGVGGGGLGAGAGGGTYPQNGEFNSDLTCVAPAAVM